MSNDGEQTQRTAEAFRAASMAFGESVRQSGARVAAAIAQGERSRRTVAELAEYLEHRDWPSTTGRGSMTRRSEYRRLAAAIVAGEAWAIRRARPEAAAEIQTRSEWPEVAR